MTQDQIEEALRRSLSNFTSPTIGRAGSIHDGQQGYILYDDHVAYIVRDLFAALTTQPSEARDDAIDLMALDIIGNYIVAASEDVAYLNQRGKHAEAAEKETEIGVLSRIRSAISISCRGREAALAPAPAQQQAGITGIEYVRAAVRNNPMGKADHKIVCDFIDALAAPAQQSDEISSLKSQLEDSERWRELHLSETIQLEETIKSDLAVNAAYSERINELDQEVARLESEIENAEAENERLGEMNTAIIAAANERISTLKAIPAQDWRPIESAPKDGLIDIWIVTNDGGFRWSNCVYDRICDEWRTSRPSGRLLSIKARCVTHWMPLPSPPLAETK